LRWSDFQASHNLLVSASVGAYTSATIRAVIDENEHGRPTFLVECFFTKKESWVRDSCAEHNQALLAHEQLHFDIAELFARKIRQKLTQCIRTGCDIRGAKLSNEINALLKKREEFDAAFDQDAQFESEAGAFDVEMRAASPLLHKWQAIVQRELIALAPYKSSATTCGEKL